MVDGNDVEAVRATVGAAVARARRGQGPTLIEARTTRRRGHWAADDQGYRTSIGADEAEDPLDLYAYRLLERGQATPAELERVHAEVAAEVAAGLERARNSPDAGPAELGVDEVHW
jgi:acetoin:2,6-dichlorophenolindophenol oxidoreductase subunit alpha